MPWLADLEVDAVHGFARAVSDARTVAELRGRALQDLARLVPADVLTWDRVELATGAVRHEAVPSAAEPPGAFETIVGARLASAPACACCPPASGAAPVRGGRAQPPSRSELYRDLLHPAGVEYGSRSACARGVGEVVVAGLGRTEREFSERDRDVLDVARPGLEGALQAAQARERLVRVLAADAPLGTAVALLDRSGEIESRASTRSAGSPSTSGRPNTRAGCRGRSPSGWRCRRARRSSAS